MLGNQAMLRLRSLSVPQSPAKFRIGSSEDPRAVPGNQAMLQRRSPSAPQGQAKLEVGSPDDPLEHEADRAAEHVMRIGQSAAWPAAARFPLPPSASGENAAGGSVQRQTKPAAPQAAAGEAPPLVHQALGETGQALDAGTRGFFEPRLETDLGGVRVHRSGLAAEAARSIGARAFTVGRDIVFGDGADALESDTGRALLGHELAHVMQQSGGTVRRVQRLSDRDADAALALIAKVLAAGRDLAARLGLSAAAGQSSAQANAAAAPMLTAAETAIEDKVLAGLYADKGEFTGTDDASFRFIRPELQAVFQRCRRILLVATGPGKLPPGDSFGKPISGQPGWVNAMQEKLTNTPAPNWNRDSRLAQKLVEAFLRAWTKRPGEQAASNQVPSNVGELYSRAGASTSNEQAAILGGVKGGQAWCDTATIRAIALGLMKGGLRFKTGTPPVKPDKMDQRASTLAALTEEIRRQTVFFHQHWYNDVTKPRAPARTGAAPAPEQSPAEPRIIVGKAAWTTPLRPGDDITVINGGFVGPLSGHVATVISETLASGKDSSQPGAAPAQQYDASATPPAKAPPAAGSIISTVRYVSGNARGSGVRAEEVKREMPPDAYDWNKMTRVPNLYTTRKGVYASGVKEWDKSGLQTKVDQATNELFHQAVDAGYSDVIDWTELAQGKFAGTPIAGLPAYAVAYELAKQALPKWRAMTIPHEKMSRMITGRRSELPVSRTDDPKFTPGRDAPVELDHSWVVSVVRASLLDVDRILWSATKFDRTSGESWDQAQLDKLSLEPLDGTIDSLYPGALDAAEKR
jgi:hypothetical protein